MSRSGALLGWLEDTSDRLSPIVVKEVRQVVRGQEFSYSFGASLLAGLAVAFFGAADALQGGGTSGNGTFVALMTCLTFLGLVVVPLGAFSALRNERMEQTLELMTLTALSPRRVVIGKLLAQAVKLATLFAAMAPFIAMSFLLGGIDFVTILVSLLVLFMWSLWASAAFLFLSCLLKSRAMSALIFGGAGIVLFVVFNMGRMFYFAATRGVGGVSFFGAGGGVGGWPWQALAIMATFCLATMTNLVLLAENRLSLPTDNRVTPLRIGFLVQFLLIAGWTLSFVNEPPPAVSNALSALGVVGGFHLAVVATFAVTEGLIVSRRVLLRMAPSSPWRWFLAMFRPGGGRGAAYVLVQMAVLVLVAWRLDPSGSNLRWFLAMCGYICFFTGVPTIMFRSRKPTGAASVQLRVAVLLLLPMSMLLPDIIHYVLWQPDVLDLTFGARHLVNPIRTLANWSFVESLGWFSAPLSMGLTGLLAYLALIHLGTRMTVPPATESYRSSSEEAAGEPGSAKALY
jgi:hypothetical protein